MGSILKDIRYGFRVLLKRPSVTCVAILTLALGVGANTAIFSVVNAVLLRPLPYPNSDRLVFLSESSQQVPDMSISMADFDDWRTMNTVFDDMAPYRGNNVTLTGEGVPESLRIREITASLFPTFGVQPILGRALTPDDDKPGSAPVVMLSDGFWTSKFGRDPNIIRKKLNLDGELYTVVGVLPTSKFHGTWGQYSAFRSLWRYEDVEGGPKNRSAHPGIYAVARMKPGVTLAQAQADMRRIAANLERQYPNSNAGIGVAVDGLLHAYVGDVGPSLLMLMAAVGFVLLIACANIANLSLARATERNHEMAVRAALGAGRGRLMRQLLTESLLLALCGGAVGLMIAYLATGYLTQVAASSVPRIDTVSISGEVLLFTLGISLFTGMLFGIIPAWQVSRVDVHESIKDGGRTGTAGAGRKRVRSALVVAEVSISLVLLISAGLTIRSLFRVVQADPGFNSADVLTANYGLPDGQYKTAAQQIRFVKELSAKIAAIPGIEVSGIKNPLLGNNQTDYGVEGKPKPKQGAAPSTDFGRVTPGALEAMGIHLLQGRYFTTADNETSEHVCIVDTKMAQTEWPGQSAVGKRIAVSFLDPEQQRPDWLRIVGVVAHTKNYGVDEPASADRAETYLPYSQMPSGGGYLVLRSTENSAALAQAAEDATLSVDPNVPLTQIRPLADIVDENVAPRRLSVVLLGAFAALALALSAVGIYGVMSYMVTQRLQEIGIRVALGAQSKDVAWLILRNGITLLVLGIAIGLAGAFSLSQFLQSLLFEVKSTDALTFAGVSIILAAVALLACYLPARRATRVDPVIALRNE